MPREALLRSQRNRPPQVLAELAKGRLRAKLPALREALTGRFQTEHHGLLVDQILAHLDYLDETIALLSARIEQVIAPFAEQVGLLATIPGVERRTAEVLVAEIGADMVSSPPRRIWPCGRGCARATTSRPAGAAWVGPARAPSGCAALTEAAKATARTKDSYLSAQYHRLKGRRGPGRATIAVGHWILVVAYHILQRKAATTTWVRTTSSSASSRPPTATPSGWSASSSSSATRSPWSLRMLPDPALLQPPARRCRAPGISTQQVTLHPQPGGLTLQLGQPGPLLCGQPLARHGRYGLASPSSRRGVVDAKLLGDLGDQPATGADQWCLPFSWPVGATRRSWVPHPGWLLGAGGLGAGRTGRCVAVAVLVDDPVGDEVPAADQGEGRHRTEEGDDGADQQDQVQAVDETGAGGGGDDLPGCGVHACGQVAAAGAAQPGSDLVGVCGQWRVHQPVGDAVAQLRGKDRPQRGDAGSARRNTDDNWRAERTRTTWH
jgi:hypothetical protein